MSTTIGDLDLWLEAVAPRALAEPWDNVGLLWGDPAANLTRVMTCLTVTSATIAEALATRASAIVSHHPVLFRPVQSVTDAPNDPSRGLWSLARGGIAVLSRHTAYDNCLGGINDQLVQALGLEPEGPIEPAQPATSHKVVVFTPSDDTDAVLAAAFAAGAGRIGDYTECSFSTPGTGTFYGSDSTNPAVGQKGRREHVSELRLEFVCPPTALAAVLAAITRAHPYEQPAIDLYPLALPPNAPGKGRLGRLREPLPLDELAHRVGEVLDSPTLCWAGPPRMRARCVAVACGAGDSFLTSARDAGADVLLTGEARFHRALEAAELGIGLITAGHHETERPGVEALATQISGAFPDLVVWPSQSEHTPWSSRVAAGNAPTKNPRVTGG